MQYHHLLFILLRDIDFHTLAESKGHTMLHNEYQHEILQHLRYF